MIERRTEARMLCADLVDVQWTDKAGRKRAAVANLEDISSAGVCLQMDAAIPANTSLKISHEKTEFRGEVRYCLFRECGYFIGVRFATGCKWSRKQFRPLHLLDLRTLVRRSANRAARRAAEHSLSS